MRVAIALILLATTPGCALLAASNVSHNSRGTACVESPIPAVIDLVIAAGLTGGLAGGGALDKSAAWMIVPGVFATSGVIGAIFAAKCMSGKEPKVRDEYQNLPVSAPYKLPAVESDVPDVSAEERGLPPPTTVQPNVKLTLDPDYQLKDPPPKTPDTSSIECDASASTCPPKHSCSLGGNGRGHCIKDRH